MTDTTRKQSKRTKLQRKNRNAMRKQLSNWFLAASLGLTGSGLVNLFTLSPQISGVIAVIALCLGVAALIASLTFLYYIETEE